MTNLTRYQISAAHIAAVRASGFDARDPDARHPVQNPIAEKILAARGKGPPSKTLASQALSQDPRVAALLRAKDGLMDRVRGRGLGLLLTTALAGMMATPALAGPVEPAAITDREITAILEQVARGFGVLLSMLPGPRDPVWATALLSGIFASQILQLRSKSVQPQITPILIAPETPEPVMPQESISPSDALPVTSEPHSPYRWLTCGASRTGKVRSENQDACRLIRIKDDEAALILCDGAGGVAGGKPAAEAAAQALADQIGAALDRPGEVDWPVTLDHAVAQARLAVKAVEEAGITTAIVAVLEGERLHYATLGDGALVTVWPDGMVQEVLAPHHVLGEPPNIIAGYIGQECAVPPRIGSVRLEPGGLTLAMSDGAGDLFPRESFAEAREAMRDEMANCKANLADQLLSQLEDARDPETGAYLHTDNLTLLIGLLARTEHGDV